MYTYICIDDLCIEIWSDNTGYVQIYNTSLMVGCSEFLSVLLF